MIPDFACRAQSRAQVSALSRIACVLKPVDQDNVVPSEFEELEGSPSVAASESQTARDFLGPSPPEPVPPPPPPPVLPPEIAQRIAANRAQALARRRAREREARRIPVCLDGLFSIAPPPHPAPAATALVQTDLHRWFTAAVRNS